MKNFFLTKQFHILCSIDETVHEFQIIDETTIPTNWEKLLINRNVSEKGFGVIIYCQCRDFHYSSILIEINWKQAFSMKQNIILALRLSRFSSNNHPNIILTVLDSCSILTFIIEKCFSHSTSKFFIWQLYYEKCYFTWHLCWIS